MTVAQVLTGCGAGPLLRQKFICTVERPGQDTLFLDPMQATTYVVLPGDILGIRAIFRGGGGRGGKNPMGMVLQIAVMVAAWYVAPYFAAGFENMGMAMMEAGADFMSATTMAGQFIYQNASMIAMGTLGMASMMASSFLVGPQKAPNVSASLSSEATNTIYSITGSSNRVNKFGAIPYPVGGTTRIYPTHACEPYTEVINNIDYIRQMFAVYGPLKISDIRLGETPLSYYTDYQIEVREGWDTDAPPTLYSTNKDFHQISVNAQMKKSSGKIIRRTDTDCDEIIFDISVPNGLYQINSSSGAKSATTVAFNARYRLVGDTVWIPWGQPNTTGSNRGNWMPGTAYVAGDTVMSPDSVVKTVMASHVSASYPVAVDKGNYSNNVNYAVNDKVMYGGLPYKCIIAHTSAAYAYDPETGYESGGFITANWVRYPASDSELFAQDASYYQPQATVISGKLDAGSKLSFRQTVQRGTYDVEWERTTADDTTGYMIDATVINSLRTVTFRNPINWNSDLPPLATVAVVIKGTGQLNGVISDLNFLGSPYLRVYDHVSDTWSYQLSDNPAWAYLGVLRGPGMKEPVPLDEIDLDAFVAWATWCTERGYKINGLVDAQRTVQSILKDIAFCGRAAPAMRDNLYSIVVDKATDVISQVITPRNSWGFEGKKQFPDFPDAIRVTFTNAEKDYQQDEVIVYIDSDETTASNFETMDTTWITDTANAYKHGRFHGAQVKLRPEEFSVSMDVEHLRATRGDRVYLVHDVIKVGQGAARIMALDVNTDDKIVAVILDNDFVMVSGKSYAMGLRKANGNLVTYPIQTIAGESRELTLVTPVPLADGPAIDNLIWFGEAGRKEEDVRIMSIEAGQNFTAKLTVRHYSHELMALADSGDIPDFDSKISDRPAIQNRVPGIPSVSNIKADETVMDYLPDGTILPRIRFSIESSLGDIATNFFGVQYREVNGQWIVKPNVHSDAATIDIDNVLDDHTYEFRVVGINSNGSTSDWSQTFTATVHITVPVPTQLSSISHSYVASGLRIEWPIDTSPYTSGYDVAVDGVVKIQNAGGNYYVAPAQSEGQHRISVRSRNIFGLVGDWQNADITVPAIATISGVLVNLNELLWSYATTSPWFAGFHLRFNMGQDDNWNAASPLHFGNWQDTRITISVYGGQYTVMLRAVDSAGNMSAVSKVFLNLGDLLPTNIIESYNILEAAIHTDETSAAWGNDNNIAWRADTEAAWIETYEGVDKEIAFYATSELSGSRMTLNQDLSGDTPKLYYRTDYQGTVWGNDSDPAWGPDGSSAWPPLPDWVIWPGALDNITHQMYYFKFTTNDGPQQGHLTIATLNFDVPDIEEIIQDMEVLTTDTVIPLTKSYRVIKHISIALQDNTLGATRVDIMSKNNIAPSLKAITANALVDVRVLGY